MLINCAMNRCTNTLTTRFDFLFLYAIVNKENKIQHS
jgi:hypothetical protein